MDREYLVKFSSKARTKGIAGELGSFCRQARGFLQTLDPRGYSLRLMKCS
jgi:hypothetical protein